MATKEQWTLSNALKILQHPTVDAKTWAEAVAWLLRYGPKSIRDILLDASSEATLTQFADLEPTGYSIEGRPFYDATALAAMLDISEEEAAQHLAEKENPANDILEHLRYYTKNNTVH